MYVVPLLLPVTATVTVDVPAFAAELPLRVSVALSLPGAPAVTLPSDGVTPAGSPLKDTVIGTLSPPSSMMVTAMEAALV